MTFHAEKFFFIEPHYLTHGKAYLFILSPLMFHACPLSKLVCLCLRLHTFFILFYAQAITLHLLFLGRPRMPCLVWPVVMEFRHILFASKVYSQACSTMCDHHLACAQAFVSNSITAHCPCRGLGSIVLPACPSACVLTAKFQIEVLLLHPMPQGGPRVVTTPEVGKLDGRNVLVFAPGGPGLFARRSFEKNRWQSINNEIKFEKTKVEFLVSIATVDTKMLVTPKQTFRISLFHRLLLFSRANLFLNFKYLCSFFIVFLLFFQYYFREKKIQKKTELFRKKIFVKN